MRKQSRGMVVVFMNEGVPTVIGQKRGRYKIKDGKIVPESYPNATQVTIHGGMEEEDGGSTYTCLHREGNEEAGPELTERVLLKRDDWVEVARHENDQREDITHALMLKLNAVDLLNLIHWHVFSGGLMLITSSTTINILTKDMRDAGVARGDEAWMHADEKAAVEAALALYAART